jgi:hypothetical protein
VISVPHVLSAVPSCFDGPALFNSRHALGWNVLSSVSWNPHFTLFLLCVTVCSGAPDSLLAWALLCLS